MKMQTFCRLCLKTCNANIQEINEVFMEIIDIILPNLNLDITTKNYLCSDCLDILQKCFKFKSTCFYTEECIFTLTKENIGQLDLRELYESKLDSSLMKIVKEQKICRLCLDFLTKELYTSLDDIPVGIIEKCIPELNFAKTKDPVICQQCCKSLELYKNYVDKCSHTEEEVTKLFQITEAKKGKLIQSTEGLQSLESKRIINRKKKKEGGKKNESSLVEPSSGGKKIIKKPFACTVCSKRFRDRSCCIRHIKTHSKRKNVMFKCHKCNFESKFKYSLKLHMITHEDVSTVKMYKCEVCPFKTKYKSGIKPHMRKHEAQQLYQCDQCDLKTKYIESIRRHIALHNSNSYIYCAHCDYKTFYKKSLQAHIGTSHMDPEKATKYRCTECQFTSFRYDDLVSHRRKHNKWTYKCKLCSYKTWKRKHLSHHELVHKKPEETVMYNCGLCTYQTKRKSDLQKHLLIHQNPSQLKLHNCGICGQGFKVKGNMLKHMILHQKWDQQGGIKHKRNPNKKKTHR